jgi:hypothetical protein
MSDITSGIGLSGYVPTSRTLTINGVSYDLTANRSWTISTVDYTSRLQHVVKAGVAINKGQAVYVTSADGTNMIVGLASNASEATSSKTMGLLDATVSTNGFANVVTEGLLDGLDTSTAGAAGDPVWLGTGGNLIYGLANKPYAPAHLVFIGIVTRKNSNNGEIFVKVQNGFELNEIHDVDLKTNLPVNGELLGFNGTLWVNKTIAGWLGYTPANASGTTNYISKFTGSTTLGNSQIFDNGTNVGIGTTSPAQKLDVAGGDIILSSNATYIRSKDASGNSPRMFGINPSNDTYIGPIDSYAGGAVFYGVSANVASQTFYTGATARLHITSGGNVGIGTVSPSIIGTGIISLDIQGSSAGGLAFGPSGIKNYIYGASTMYIEANTTAVFATSGTEKMRLTTGGQLIVGGTTVGYAGTKLQVGNTSDSQNGLNILTSTTGYGYILFGDGAGADTYVGQIWYYHADNYMGFQTNGSEKLRITSNGNVGIGTTNPSASLDVKGVSDTSGAISLQLRSGNTSGNFDSNQITLSYNNTSLYRHAIKTRHNSGSSSGNAIDFYTWQYGGLDSVIGGQHVMSLDGANLGVGTTSPTATLHVVGTHKHFANTGAGTNLVRVDQYGTDTNYRLDYKQIVSSGLVKHSYNIVNNGTSYDNNLVLDRGNVGIGTDSPSHNLHLYGAGDRIIKIENSGTYLMYAGLVSNEGYIGSTNATPLGFYTNNVNRIYINTSGNVGIGTTSPGYKLDISTTSGTSVFRTSDTTTAYKSFSIDYSSSFITQVNFGLFGRFEYEGNGGVLSIENRSTQAGSSMMRFVMGTTERMRITDTGNVGIGTTSPAYKLDVNGSIRTSGVNGLYIDASANFGDNSGANFDILNLGSTRALRILATTVGGWGNILLNPYGANVGIGTTAPTNRLQIGSIGSSGYGGNDLAIGNGTQVMAFYQSATVSTWYTNTSFSLMPSGSGSVGYVGIGTLTPSTLLDVSGVITATGGNSTNWNTAYGWGNHASANYVPQARTLTINGTSYDLSANRSWTIATTTPGGSDTQVQYNSSGSLAGASALTYNSTTNRVGINQASPGYDLDVNGQVRVQDKLRIGTGNGVVHMSSTATINASATTVVWAQTVSVGMCAFIEYYILNNNSLTDQRAGTIMVTWNQSGTPTITHTETTTPDIGSTTTVNFTSSLVGSDARINAVNSSANPYTMVMSFKYF